MQRTDPEKYKADDCHNLLEGTKRSQGKTSVSFYYPTWIFVYYLCNQNLAFTQRWT